MTVSDESPWWPTRSTAEQVTTWLPSAGAHEPVTGVPSCVSMQAGPEATPLPVPSSALAVRAGTDLSQPLSPLAMCERVTTGAVLSMRTVTGSSVEPPSLEALQVKDCPVVSVKSAAVAQPLVTTSDSGSVTSQLIATSPAYQSTSAW